MTTPPRYRTTTGVNVGGRAYEDEEQTRFAFHCAFYSFGLPSYDDFIDSMEDGIAKNELIAWRQKAFIAFKNNNQLALEGWLQAMWVNWKSRLTNDGIRHTLTVGFQRLQKQSKQGKKGAEVRWASRDATSAIIERLALAQEYREWTAEELWPVIFSELDSEHLDPEETNNNDWRKASIAYNTEKGRNSITGKTFANKVSTHRSKQKSR